METAKTKILDYSMGTWSVLPVLLNFCGQRTTRVCLIQPFLLFSIYKAFPEQSLHNSFVCHSGYCCPSTRAAIVHLCLLHCCSLFAINLVLLYPGTSQYNACCANSTCLAGCYFAFVTHCENWVACTSAQAE